MAYLVIIMLTSSENIHNITCRYSRSNVLDKNEAHLEMANLTDCSRLSRQLHSDLKETEFILNLIIEFRSMQLILYTESVRLLHIGGVAR